MAFESGPYLVAAILCEKILVEQDGLKSLIRIFDRTTRQITRVSPPEVMEPFDFDHSLFLSFKSGQARGPMTLRVTVIRPTGESPPPFQAQLHFEGEDDRGVDIAAQMRLHVEIPGMYWFVISLDGVPVTRIPWRVLYEPRISPTPA